MKNIQKLHYPFCGELKNNVSLASSSVSFPKLAIFKINTNFADNIWNSFAGSNFKDLEGINFIDDLVIEKVHRGMSGLGDLTESGGFRAFIGPHDFLTASSKKKGTRCYYYDQIKDKLTFQETDGQKWFRNQSHLVEHTTFQLFFLDKMLGTYNLGKMDYEIEEGKIIINYTLVVKATPSGVFYKFMSNELSPPIRWELKVRGNLITMRAAKEAYSWVKDKFNKFQAAAKNLAVKLGTAGLGEWKEGEDTKKGQGVLIGSQDPPGTGIQDESSSGGDQELQTDRLLKETQNPIGEISNPFLYYTNTTDYYYNFFDFWMRLNEWDRILTSRIVFSSDLYNNLKHNNNENPITYPLNITFQKFGSILRKGYWQGKLRLAYDPDGNMAKCFARGVTFFEDMEKDFPKPDLGISQQFSSSLYSLGGVGDTYIAEEIKEWVTTDIPFDYRPEAKGYGHSTYLTVDNDSVRNNEWRNLGGCHWDSQKGWCWGCTQQTFSPTGYSGSAHDPNSPSCPPFADKMVGKFTPSQNCNFEGKFHVDGSNTHTQSLNAGTEYEIWVNHTKIWFRYLKSETRLQKVPGHDDFSGMDWTPPPGSGGDIEIPLTELDLKGIDPEANPDIGPEQDFIPDIDPGGPGEVEITPLDITVDTDFTTDIDNPQDIEPPPVEVDPPFETDLPKDKDHDKSKDTGDKDPGDDDDEKPEDFD